MSRLEQDLIERSLKTRWVGRTLKIVDECTSTNDIVKGMAERGAPHGLVVVAETQTAGRGRLSHVWYSPKGGIWLSILTRHIAHISSIGSLPLVGALAIAKTIARLGVPAKVRWPNDVVVGRRKVAGVLVETQSKGSDMVYAILGLGINANVDMCAIPEISSTSVSLLSILGREINREELVAGVLTEMEEMYELLTGSGSHALEDLLRQFDCSCGCHVKVSTGEKQVSGVVEGYVGLGRVRIATQNGPVWIDTSDVASVDYQFD